MVIAIGELEDMEIDNIDMDKLSENIKYNGSHSTEGYWKTNDEIIEAISKLKK